MGKIIFAVLIVAILALGGFIVYQNMGKITKTAPESTTGAVVTPKAVSVSPIFGYLSSWVPGAAWSIPASAMEDTPYGKVSGMESGGKVTSGQDKVGRNFEDQNVMTGLGFVEDINFAADGPGASNWGYSKTENGQKQVVIFSYSSNRIFGPESTSPPFLNVSVFVSDPFTPTATP